MVKYFFQPNADEVLSYAQITGVSQTALRQVPPGTTPPFILAYDASTVPIIQLALSSDSLSEAAIFDAANNTIRTELATIPGAAIPYPYGGKQRQVQVDLDAQALRSKGLSGSDVVAAIAAQNLILPAGTQKIGDLEYYVGINASPEKVEEMNDLPIAASKRHRRLCARRRARARRLAAADQHCAHGGPARRADDHPEDRQGLHAGCHQRHQGEAAAGAKRGAAGSEDPADRRPVGVRQGLHLRRGPRGHHRGLLTGLMILLFLGSWRSTLIIFISIPLSILASIACLAALGETINIMTLGGLALAVGILVDDATVTIENINSHLEEGAEVEDAILKGAQQIALPALVSTLAICIVFVPMFLLAGIAKFLFVPLAEAVVFAMLASYLLSRTLVPTLSKYWLQKHEDVDPEQQREAGFLKRWQGQFERGLRSACATAIMRCWRWPCAAAINSRACSWRRWWPPPSWRFPFRPTCRDSGQDFFPVVDAGQIKLHLRARTGLRIEETAALCDHVEALIRQIIPAEELQSIVDNIGLPYSGINLSYSTSAPVGPERCRHLRRSQRSPSSQRQPTCASCAACWRTAFRPRPSRSCRRTSSPRHSTSACPAPSMCRYPGSTSDANREFANNLLQKMRDIPGAVDLRVQQAYDYPTLNVDVDRTKARQFGLTQQNVASNILVSLSGSFQTTPSFWTDPKTGTQYNVVAQSPQPQLAVDQRTGHHADHQRRRRQPHNCLPISPPSIAAPAPRS